MANGCSGTQACKLPIRDVHEMCDQAHHVKGICKCHALGTAPAPGAECHSVSCRPDNPQHNKQREAAFLGDDILKGPDLAPDAHDAAV
jgi:hypothetical protein